MITSIGAACLSSLKAVPDRFVTLDSETTGLFGENGDAPGIVSLGACLVMGNSVVDRFSVNVKPDRPIEAEATQKNGVTDGMAASFQLLEDVWADFKAYLDGEFAIAHNMEFDWGVIMQNAHRHAVDLPEPESLFCSLNATKLYGRLVLNSGQHGASLAKLTDHFGTYDGRAQIDDRHDAGVDAEQLAHLIIRLKNLAG